MLERSEEKYFRYSIITDNYYLGLVPKPFLSALSVCHSGDYCVRPGNNWESLIIKKRKSYKSFPGPSLSGLQDVYIPREALEALEVMPGGWVALTLDPKAKHITITKKLPTTPCYHDWQQLSIFDQELMDALEPELQVPSSKSERCTEVQA